MELTFGSRLRHAWDVFRNREPTYNYADTGPASSYSPYRNRLTGGNDRSIVTSIFNRIALDVASIDIRHCRTDENGRFKEYIDSSLDNCLKLEANIDQTGRAFIQDVVLSLLDEGCVAIIPVDTTFSPLETTSYDILSLRTGKIVQWYPKHVMVNVYNENTGQREDIKLPKSMVAIIENPLYAVVNEQNSTMKRLMRKLVLLDSVDENTSSGKLDMIIQLPYTIKSDTRKVQAEKRRQSIEEQLKGPYGIAYIDGTEKVIQLNRPIENNLLKQIESLTKLLYSQLGITEEILNGTADEQTMLNYISRTIEPIVSAIVDNMKRTFLTKTARSQLQTLMFFRDPFKLVPVNNIAEIADKFTRNEIMTSNEIRGVIGMKPSDDPKADKLINSNLNQADNGENIPLSDDSSGKTDNTKDTLPMTVSFGDLSVSSLPDIDQILSIHR